ncbi:DUF2142 domain-containing protein [Butyrivibrio sp. AE2005]|uniref:DUF2142 domain-containing protein n=1 Tax=Butyrivibrio sp. AE2005 TaxID=1496722 RepID=UPI00047DE1A2|nr:DUF2142 domain-containing protein [Butyrivibrio sp. AE2005]
MKRYLKILGLLIWTIFLLWLFPLDDIREYSIKRVGVPAKDTLFIFGDNVVVQNFSCDKDFNAIELAVSFYDTTYYSDGLFTIKIYDENYNCIKSQDISRIDIEGEYIAVSLPYTCKKDKLYTIEISAPTLEKNNCIKINTYADSTRKNAEMNGVILDSSIGIATYESKSNVLIIFALILYGIGIIIWIFDNRHILEQKAFSLIMLLGIAFMLCITPYSVPDEYTHYCYALRLSNILLHQEDIGLIDAECLNSQGIIGHKNANSSFATILNSCYLDKIDEKIYIYEGSQMINLIMYFFSAIGIVLGRMVGAGFLQIFYLGRLFNLVIYAMLSSLAIRIIPKNKELLFIIATMPICLQQGMSYSYDSMLNGLSFLFIAYVLYVYETTVCVGWEQIFYIGVLSCLLTPIKIIYGVLLLFTLIIPVNKFKNKRDRIIKYGVIVAMNIGILLLTDVYAIIAKAKGYVLNGYRTYTIHDLFDKPIYFIHFFSVSFANSFIEWGKSAIGSMLSGCTLLVPEWMILGYAIALLLMLIYEDGYRLNLTQRHVIFFTVLLGVLGIMVAGFAWTVFGKEYIEGIQGRYFVPFLLPGLILLRSIDLVELKRKVDSAYLYWLFQIAVIVWVGSNVVY